MAIVVQCNCGKRFAARDDLAGKTLACPACGESLTVPGGKVEGIENVEVVEEVALAKEPEPAPPPAAPQPIVVTCDCGARFAARPDLAGKTLKCPKCGQSLTVPGGAAPATPKAAAPPRRTASPAPAKAPPPAPPKVAAPAPPKAPGAKPLAPAASKAPPPPSPAKPPAKAPAAPKEPAPGDMGPSSPGGLADLLDEVGLLPTKTGVRCQKCRADMKPGEVLCVQCGYNHETDSQTNTRRWT